MNPITHTEVRMYRMGTGDCFAMKFFAGEALKFKMMIDCGTWSGAKARLRPYVENLKAYFDNHVDLLVVTHEHKDHVYGFEACKELFSADFKVDEVWMGWTEEDGTDKVQTWKQEYGDHKRALALAAAELKKAAKDPAAKAQLADDANGLTMHAARERLSAAVENLSALHVSEDPARYVGPLVGMKFVKDNFARDAQGKKNFHYRSPGEVLDNIPELPGVRFYVLGPPLNWTDVKVETGGKGEVYNHNLALSGSKAFAAAMLAREKDPSGRAAGPFDESYSVATSRSVTRYDDKSAAWRRIDYDWLNSAGALGLRMDGLTNNLSLALAIEFTGSGRIMLFPGDAEYGSWASWHTIPWKVASRTKGKSLTEDILNRTVFYKVAHHLSHNGTAARLGLEMMNHPDLAAMATLDYGVISEGWMGTMPNHEIVTGLLDRTKGRLMIMQEKGLKLTNTKTVTEKIAEARKRMSQKEKSAFTAAFVEHPLYLQYTVKAS